MSAQRVALLTAFEPFGGEPINSSERAVSAVEPAQLGADVQLVRATLPVVFGECIAALEALLEQHRPDVVLCVGQAGGRAQVSVERVAINVDDARIADNAGATPIDRAVIAEGPAAYFATLPVKAIVAALREAEIPAEVSQSAGTFVCNHLFYGLMHTLRESPAVRAGFAHVPLLPEQVFAGMSSRGLPLEQLARALELTLQVALHHDGPDLQETGGALS